MISISRWPRWTIACSAGKICLYARSPVAPKKTNASDCRELINACSPSRLAVRELLIIDDQENRDGDRKGDTPGIITFHFRVPFDLDQAASFRAASEPSAGSMAQLLAECRLARLKWPCPVCRPAILHEADKGYPRKGAARIGPRDRQLNPQQCGQRNRRHRRELW